MNHYASKMALLVGLFTAAAGASSLTLTLSAVPAIYGQSVTLTAAVTPSSATGKVTFYDGTSILGIAPVSAGIATLTTTQLGYGNRTLKAHYSGDAKNSAASSTPLAEIVAAISGAGFPTFNPNVTPANTNFIATGDFNGDGHLDLVLTMVNEILILPGNGDGGFTAGQPFPAGNVTSVTSVAVGDFNGDGIADLAVSDYADTTPGSPNYIWVLLGRGNGTFGAPVAFAVDCAPVELQVADFNQDGIADIAAVGSPVQSGDISILLGTGNGAFRGPFDYSTVNASQGAIALTIGDFNGDQIPDLAVLDTGMSILLGRGDGTFSPATGYATGNVPIGIASGDFNRDGITDLVVANNVDGTVSIYLGKGFAGIGNGAFQAQTPYAVEYNPLNSFPSSVTVGDFNGDNISDVAVANFEDGISSTISVMLGTGNGALQSSVVYAGGAGAQVIVQGDFNNDGAIDLAVADGNGSNTNGSAGVLMAQRCYFAVSAPPLNFDASGGTPFLNISTTDSGCGWSASVTPPGWVLLSAVSGFGGGQVAALVAANTTGAQRTGSLAVSGQTLPVNQWATTQIFTDVTPANYDFDAVNLLRAKNITQGCTTTAYCPSSLITRAQMAIFIVRAVYGSDNFPYSPNPYFSDVAPADFGFKWIQRMFEMGITAGCAYNAFCPGNTVTRDQMAVFIVRARYGSATPFTSPTSPYFADVPTGAFAFPWIQRLREDNVTSGCSSTTYCPSSPVTRGDMAIFVMRGTLNALYPPTQPLITSISPATLARGTSRTFTITASATNFVQGATVMVSTGGITASNLTVTSATSFTVTLTAAPDAPEQPVSIYVRTGGEEAVLPNGLIIP